LQPPSAASQIIVIPMMMPSVASMPHVVASLMDVLGVGEEGNP